MKIIIDPGHGGRDFGGGSNDYWKEKEMNLKISKHQYHRLKDLGICVELTRKEDVDLSPSERTRIVRNSGATICLSNHINGFHNTSVEGAEVIHSIHNDGRLAKLILKELVIKGATERRVFSKVHPTRDNQDYYYMHRDTGSVETVIIEYGFGTNKRDTEKLLKHWRDYAEAVIHAVTEYIDFNYHKEDKRVKLVGEAKASLYLMKQWAKKNGGSEKFIRVSELYVKYGILTGLRGDILYCQSAKETNFGKYTGVVTEEMNNFAGIKVKNPKGEGKEDHEKFATEEDGVRGQFNHMCAYVGIKPIGEVHDRYHVVKSLSWAGTVVYVNDLGGKWAPNENYGDELVESYLNKLLTIKGPEDYQSRYKACEKEKRIIKDVVAYLKKK